MPDLSQEVKLSSLMAGMHYFFKRLIKASAAAGARSFAPLMK
jgi:hypothetical protein